MPIHENLICLCPRTAQEHLSALFDHHLMTLYTSDPELVSLDRRERIQKEFADYRNTIDADDQASPYIERKSNLMPFLLSDVEVKLQIATTKIRETAMSVSRSRLLSTFPCLPI